MSVQSVIVLAIMQLVETCQPHRHVLHMPSTRHRAAAPHIVSIAAHKLLVIELIGADIGKWLTELCQRSVQREGLALSAQGLSPHDQLCLERA